MLMPVVFAWAGGAAFVLSLAYFLYTYLVTLASPVAGEGTLRAAVLDVLLFLLFAAHHSLFARARAKRWVVRVVPSPLERSFYVWVASLLLVLVCAAWRPVPGIAYDHRGLAAAFHLICVGAGLVLTALGARVLSPLHLAGIDQARGRERACRQGPLVTRFPYNLVRHPIYLGWLLVVFGVPLMTWNRFLMACLTGVYLVVAVRWEEQLLVKQPGAAYEDYRRRVRWRMIPFIY